MGSSPLARGTPGGEAMGYKVTGLIPARAGNTSHALERHLPARAHPRSRGEHHVVFEDCPGFKGSSPLARGTQAADLFKLLAIGLIPARAGNTNIRVHVIGDLGAHPRSRGEHSHIQGRHINTRGSSPLARGTQNSCRSWIDPAGLIPARAGNTRHRVERVKSCRAHPRSRGEHTC